MKGPKSVFRTKAALLSLISAALLAGGAMAATTAAASPRHHAHAGKHSNRPLVTGRLGAGGYTVVAVGFNGKVTVAKGRSFSLSIPASEYTLQLINAHGRYAGPIVVGGESHSKVIVGLKGAAALGTINVVASKGYAHVARRVPGAWLVRSRWAWAKHGVPIGNGRNFGLVVSPTKGTGPTGPGGDSDRSGIPNLFDIAPGGNAVIKSLEPAVSGAREVARIAGAGNPLPPAGPSGTGAPAWMSQMFLPIDQTVNEDATGMTQAEIDSTLQANLNLKLENIPSADTVELDCNGLSYCSAGGTGQASEEGIQPPVGQPGYPEVPFPAATLDPATGFGEVVGPNVPNGFLGTLTGNGASEFSLYPNATTSQIGSGDVISLLTTSGGVTTQTPTTVNFVFATVPAIASYSDTAGDSGAITYPDTSGLGTQNNPIKVAPGPNGDVVVNFTAYRPQRAGIAGAGEPAYMDIGNLAYAFDSVSAPSPGQTTVGQAVPPACPASTYSNLSPTLTATNTGGSGAQSSGDLVDSAGDQPASPSNTISFSVDISACMATKGQTFPVGQPVMFDISANSQSSPDHSNQTFWLERTS
jgi:hypothetical protein